MAERALLNGEAVWLEYRIRATHSANSRSVPTPGCK